MQSGRHQFSQVEPHVTRTGKPARTFYEVAVSSRKGINDGCIDFVAAGANVRPNHSHPLLIHLLIGQQHLDATFHHPRRQPTPTCMNGRHHSA